MTCPTFEELNSAREQPAAYTATLVHVGGCPQCTRLWSALTLLRDAPRAVRWPDVKASLAQAARRTAAAISRAAAAPAVLVLFDSASGAPPVVALRGAGPTARHLVLAAGALRLDLAVLTDAPDGGDTLVGQLSGARDVSAASCLLAGAHGARWTPLEAGGDFRFEHVAPARYLLAVDAEADRLLVPDLDLTAIPSRDPLH